MSLAEWKDMMRSAGYNMNQPLRNERELVLQGQLIHAQPPLEVRFEREARLRELGHKRGYLEHLRDRLNDAIDDMGVRTLLIDPPVCDVWRRLYDTGFHIEGI